MSKHQMTTDELWQWLCEMRDIETPCKDCGGAGVKAYDSTSTWGGGIGGQMITSGVCDRCWGSGDENKRWPSHRHMAALKAEVERLRAPLSRTENSNV